MRPAVDSSDSPHKVVFVGPFSSGKTSLIRRYAGEGFGGARATVGLDFVRVKNPANGEVFLVWDTAGQERYSVVTPSYMRDAKTMVVVFDVTSNESWKSVPYWVNIAKENGPKGVPVLVVGNKAEDTDDRAHPYGTYETGAMSLGCGYVEASAKLNYNVNHVFESIFKIGSDGGTSGIDNDRVEVNLVLRDARERYASVCCNPL